MDQLLYSKISECITDPKTWCNWVRSVPFNIYKNIIRQMIPQKQVQFTQKKEVLIRRPWIHEFFGVLPNGNRHGLLERYEKYHRPNTPGDMLEWQRVLTTNYNNGRKDGVETSYAPFTQRILWENTFVNGLLHGPRRHFYDNGNVSSYEEFHHDKRIGKHVRYHYNGTIQSEFSYNENGNGKLHGTQYLKNGTTTIEYNDGFKHGLEHVQDQNSLSWTNWVNGKKHGERIIYNELGQIVLHEIWADDSMIESIVAPPQKVLMRDSD